MCATIVGNRGVPETGREPLLYPDASESLSSNVSTTNFVKAQTNSCSLSSLHMAFNLLHRYHKFDIELTAVNEKVWLLS